ncbi:hypothetical protein Vadar_022377 [Vaccinium darrowii]|uniref:Uncharacterized protein n=1 Tax=Vaccinium darrowii TaxID=229202 RepID=A0ACB7Y279_9ERIC|nr:hypothetical protein Vadar_022377 [Vaccinium darrowii]
MGFVSILMSFFGFGVGISIGLVFGYYLFIYFQPSDVKDPHIRPLVEQDSETLQRLLPEIPLWVKNPYYDRVDWLNKFIETMWPYLDKAICKTAKTIAKPIIAEQIPKYKIESVEFEALTLGSLPPTFQGIKVYTTLEKEFLMELSMKWAGNPNITIAAKAFGLRATVQVVDLQVFACPRITLKPLVPTFPCFAKILVSLMDKPHVDFGLKVFGVDAMSIPGLYRFVQELIKDQVANMYLWPKTLEVPIMDPAKAMNIQKAPYELPDGGGLLAVIVHEAEDVEGKHHTNPQVRLLYRGEERRTKAIKKNRDPRWDEEFQFMLDEPPSNSRIHVEVVSTPSWMGLLHPKEALGYVDINLSDVVTNKRINERYHLINSQKGRVQIEMQWRTSS